jgi:hypothetical protein
MIRSEHTKSCLAAQIGFLLIKGPGSFKKNFKIGGNVNKLKAYRLIPLTPPLFFHFTLPLTHFSISFFVFLHPAILANYPSTQTFEEIQVQ